MIRLQITLLSFFSLLSSLYVMEACASKNTSDEIAVLFVGNSLTYANDLPKSVAAVAKEKGVTIKTKMIAFPNYALIDHWNDGKIQEEISKNSYDFVVVQQGPSSQAYGREVLLNYGEKLQEICQKNNTSLCFFMVWPSLTYYHTFEGVIKNYSDAAATNNAILLPVGEVWKAYFDATNNYDYYASDGFHPSEKGSQIAAQVIVEYLLKSR